MELALFVYMIDVLSRISIISGLFIFSVPFCYLMYSMFCHIEGYDILYKKTAIVVFVLSLMISVSIPSKETMYTMAAAYAGQVAAESLGKTEIPDKVLKIINNKLDEYVSSSSASKSKE